MPGAKLQVTRDRWYAFVGMKTALLLNDLILEKERMYGFMAGAGVDLLETLRLEADGGYFQKGIVPGLANQGIEAPVNAAGGLGRSSCTTWACRWAPASTSGSTRTTPTSISASSRPSSTRAGCRTPISLEGSYLVQTLEDPDVFAADAAAAGDGGRASGAA